MRPVTRQWAGWTKNPSWLTCFGVSLTNPIFSFAAMGLVTSMAFFVVFAHFLVSLVSTLLEESCLSLHLSLLLQSLIATLIFLALSLDVIVL